MKIIKRNVMFASTYFRTSMIVCTLLTASVTWAATMARSEYSAAKGQISGDYKTDRAACDKNSGNERDICTEKAKAKEKVAKAELEYNYTGKASDAKRLAIVKGDTTYSVAKEMCESKTRNDKSVCMKEAKAAHIKATADAKMTKNISDAKKSATDDKRDAEYDVATQKCESLTGDVKAACVNQAKMKFGKN